MTTLLSPAPAAKSDTNTDTGAASTVAEPVAGSAGPRTSRFAPAWRARGSRRITAALVAAGDVDGRPARLALTLERVALAHVTYRSFDSDFSVLTGPGTDPKVASALTAVATKCGIRGRCEVAMTAPGSRDSGADVAQASAYAAVEALLEATEMPFTTPLRRTVTSALGQPAAIPAEDGFGVHDDETGLLVRRFDDSPRFHVLLVHQPGSSTASLSGPTGSLPSGPIPAAPEAAARWLAAANGTPTGRVGAALMELVDREEAALAVVGGHTGSDPYAVLVGGGHPGLREAQLLLPAVRDAVRDADASFRVTFALQGRVS